MTEQGRPSTWELFVAKHQEHLFGPGPVHAAHPKQRVGFKTLLLSNPNYFGNLAGSKFQPVFPLSGDTYYEKLTCVGYQPQQKRLEAVVHVYQPGGYGGGICSPGTPEFVRFYLSFDHGATWRDQGMTSFQAYDIPEGTDGDKRLEYAVSLPIDPPPKFCWVDPLIQVRAILSWNNPPPPDQPNWPPIWGNVLNANILVEPFRLILPPILFDLPEVQLPPILKEIIDPEVPIQTKAKALTAQELATLYAGKDVPAHRFAFKEIASFVSSKSSLSVESFAAILPGIEINPDIIAILFPPTDGDISYEELKCIGLDPNFPDTLVGVIQVKKQVGYSGGPCTYGSHEYVTFWADFDGNGSFETCLGTADVRVYDTKIPDGGVYYAVRLPVDFSQYRQPCKRGPKVVRIRAILSWRVPVPCADPNKVPVWGNREETLINIAPGLKMPGGKIAILGGIPVSFIDNVSGLTTSDAYFAINDNLHPDDHGRPCPFAGWVTAQGAPLLGKSYKVEATPAGGGASAAVVADLRLTRQDGTAHVHKANSTTQRFDYVPFEDNIISVLAQWHSPDDALWEIKLTTYDGPANDASATAYGIDKHLIQLDNTRPEVSITIETGTGNCGKFVIQPGSSISGTFVARDANLRRYRLHVEPTDVNPAAVNPSSGLDQTLVAGNVWTLQTEHMQSCGYVIMAQAWDRAIVNSQAGGDLGNYNYDSAGFCLVNPGN